MNERDRVRLQHMLDEARKAQQFIQGHQRADLDTNDLLAYAVRYALQIVGEAASQVTAETRAQYPQIPWKDVIGMRQWLVHGYERVENDIVWNTVTQDIGSLVDHLEMILMSNPTDETE